MWVYDAKEAAQKQLTQRPEPTPRALLDAEEQSAHESDFAVRTLSPAFSDEAPVQAAGTRSTAQAPAPKTEGNVVLPRQARRAAAQRAKPRQPLLRFVVVYGAGLCLSGVILAANQGDTAQFLHYYAQNWLSLFFESGSPLHLFSTLFLSGVLSMTLILLLGLSAFGIPFVYALLACKGAGSGLLALELFLKNGWKGELLYILFPAVSDVFLAWCLCSLSYFAVKASRGFLGRSFQGDPARPPDISPKMLVSRYLYLCTLQILSCGLSAVIAQYAVRWLPFLGL